MAINTVSTLPDSVHQAPDRHRIGAATRDHSLRAAVVGASVTFDSGIRDRPLDLIYRTAIDRLNELLEPQLGPRAIETASSSGMDFSPEAVAERIVSFATGFFGAYRENHPDDEAGGQLSGFMELIRGAIDKGFEDARGILESLGVLQGGIKDTVDRTYGLVQERLAAFEARTASDLGIG